MEWYWVLFIMVMFVAVAGILVYLGKKGYLSNEMFKGIQNVIAAIDGIVDVIDSSTENDTVTVFNQIVDLVEMAVYAAENAWYNQEITKDERKTRCLMILDDLLVANGITMSAPVKMVLDSLIAAACEAMGHTVQATQSELLTAEGDA